MGDLLADSEVGHAINEVLGDKPEDIVNAALGRGDFICSELGAYALASQPEFAGKGVLAGPLDAIDPQELFEDQVLFEPWANASGHGPALNHL